jgi:hypothetical protein
MTRVARDRENRRQIWINSAKDKYIRELRTYVSRPELNTVIGSDERVQMERDRFIILSEIR